MPEERVHERINNILGTVGVLGKYQLVVFTWTFFVGSISQTIDVIIPFAQADMDFRCIQSNFSKTSENFSNMDDNHIPSCYANSTEPECSEYEYDHRMFTSTIVSQFDLVCSRATLVILVNMLHSAMGLPGGLLCGAITDKIGRKKAIIIYLLWKGLCGLATAFSTNMTMYIIMRCATATALAGIWDSTSTLLSEITSPERRPHILVGYIFSWSTAIWLVTLLSYFIRDWSNLYIVISVPCLLLTIPSLWIYDESPHWLVSQRRYDEAQRVIDKMARMNNLQEDKSHIINKTDVKLTNDNNKKETPAEGCRDIFKSTQYLKIIAICSVCWLGCGLAYTGLLLGITELGGDLFRNSFIGGAVEFLAYTVCFLTVKIGRKGSFVLLQLIGGAALIVSGFAVSYTTGIWLVVIPTMIGRLCVSASWQVMYIWSLELFPTTVRVFMIQIVATSGKIGNTIGPLFKDLKKIMKDDRIREEMIAPCLYGSLLLVAGILALYLPETNKQPLPVTIQEAVAARELERIEKKRGKEGHTRPEETSLL